VDFRSLVKDLASVFRTRIELRQIGVRDEAKMLGGLGPCGRPICCGAFLGDFQPVSIKMAKEQNLSLNPTKISGVCGRLMCCLKYEEDNYEQTRKNMPRIGKDVETPDGFGTVIDLNILKETVMVRIRKGDSSELKTFPVQDVRWFKPPQPVAPRQAPAPEKPAARRTGRRTERTAERQLAAQPREGTDAEPDAPFEQPEETETEAIAEVEVFPADTSADDELLNEAEEAAAEEDETVETEPDRGASRERQTPPTGAGRSPKPLKTRRIRNAEYCQILPRVL
jgi:hypothetical protein